MKRLLRLITRTHKKKKTLSTTAEKISMVLDPSTARTLGSLSHVFKINIVIGPADFRYNYFLWKHYLELTYFTKTRRVVQENVRQICWHTGAKKRKNSRFQRCECFDEEETDGTHTVLQFFTLLDLSKKSATVRFTWLFQLWSEFWGKYLCA